MSKRSAALVSVLPSIMLILVLCTGCCVDLPLLPTASPTLTPSPTPVPKVLTVCMLDEPDSLYFYGTGSVAARHVWEAIYDGPYDSRTYAHQPVLLTQLPSLDDGTAAIQTVVVQSGERVVDVNGNVVELAPGVVVEDANGQRVVFDSAPLPMQQMVVTYTLQPGLTWSDGQPLTADDSVFSFQVAADPATPGDKTIIDRTAGYDAAGANMVVWRGVPGHLDRYYYLNLWHPLPRHAWGHLSAAELLTSDLSVRQPLGWGAFALAEWVPGDHITVVRNPAYFRASSGLPRLDAIMFRFIPDPIVLGEELVGGRCDVVSHESVDPVRATLPEETPQVQVVSAYDARWELLAFGISPNRDYDRPDFFEDVRVRQGIALCLDRQTVAQQVAQPPARVQHSYVPPDHALYAGSMLTVWEYDPLAGQALLAEAGWYDEDGDGVREAHLIPGIADGTPFHVTYRTTGEPARVQASNAIQSYLAACGIRADVEIMPPETLFAPGPEGVLFGRRFDLAQFSWRATADPLCDTFLSGQVPDTGRWDRPNVAGFLDDEFDTACLSALDAFPGSDGYVVAHAEAQRIFSERLPVIPLYQYPTVTLVRTSVIGLTPNPTQASELWNIEQLDLRP
jgi:peptide/nickel transport system substrate-binding protein